MLTVAVREHDEDEPEEFTAEININGNCLFARSCHNTGETNDEGEHKYCVDDGSTVWHDQRDGAVALAIKLLETIDCPKVNAVRRGENQQ